MISFLFGIYIAVSIGVGLIYAFLKVLGGGNDTLLGIVFQSILIGISWPISLFFKWH